MNMLDRFVKYCVLILILQLINISFSFDYFSNYSFRRVKDSGSTLWQKLEIALNLKAGESLSQYGLVLKSIEVKSLLPGASNSIEVTSDLIAALELSQAQALTAFNHRGDGRASSSMTETNIATVSRKIIEELAQR